MEGQQADKGHDKEHHGHGVQGSIWRENRGAETAAGRDEGAGVGMLGVDEIGRCCSQCVNSG